MNLRTDSRSLAIAHRTVAHNVAHNRGSRRASAIVLAISSIVFMLLIGLSLVTMTGHQSTAATAIAKSNQTDASLENSVAYISYIIDQDWRKSLEHPIPAGGPDIESFHRYATSMHPATATSSGYHAFLAATAPKEDAVWAIWPQISNLANSGDITKDFYDIDLMTPLTLTSQALSYVAYTPANWNTAADADGDGIFDSRWTVLPFPKNDGVKYVLATRIIDNASMNNVNTASVLHTDVLGTTPGDVSLYDLLSTTDGTATTWGTGFDVMLALTGASTGNDYTTPSTPWVNFFTNRGLAYTAVAATTGTTSSDRQNNWTNLGSKLGRFLRTTSGTPTTGISAVLWDSEVELRMRNSTNLMSRSRFERQLDGTPTSFAANGALRSYSDASSPTLINTNFTRLRADRRRLLTIYNATRNYKVWLDFNYNATVDVGELQYRKPMPPYLDALVAPVNADQVTTFTASNTLDTSFGTTTGLGIYSNTYTGNTYDPTVTDNTVPFYKLDPSWNTTYNRVNDSLSKLGMTFSAALGSSYPYPRSRLGTGSVVNDGIPAGYALAANIHAQQTTDVYNCTTSSVIVPPPVSSAVFGVKRQPFFKEVNTMIVYQDRANAAGGTGSPADMQSDNGGDNDQAIQPAATGAQTEVIGRYLTIELGNPFPTGQDINLSPGSPAASSGFYLRINGATSNLIPLSGTIPANNGKFVIYTSGGTIPWDAVGGVNATRPFTASPAQFMPASTRTATDNDYVAMINTIVSSGTNKLAIDPQTFTAYDFAPGSPLRIELIYAQSLSSANSIAVGDKYVVVDQIGFGEKAVANWTAPALTAVTSVGTETARWIVSRSIARDDRTPLIGGVPSGFPNYVFSDDPDHSSAADPGANIEKIYLLDSNASSAAAIDPAVFTCMTGSTSILGLGTADPKWVSTSGGADTYLAPAARTKPFAFIIKNAPITTIGEIASFPTVGHVVASGGQAYPVTCMLGRLLAQTTAMGIGVVKDGYEDEELGYLHFANCAVRGTPPMITPAMTIFDALDMVAPAANEPKTYGQINPNTAPREVLETLPFMVPNVTMGVLPSPYNLATSMISYREKSSSLSPAFNDRASTTTLANLRTGESANLDFNFTSIGELLAVRGDPTAGSYGTSFIDSVGRDKSAGIPTNNNGSVNSLFPVADGIANDAYERNAVFHKISNCIENRSDVFTAYVLLQGMKEDKTNPGHYITASKRRFVFTVDRANELFTGNDATEAAGVITSGMNAFTQDIVGCTAYVSYRGNWPSDADSRAYKAVITAATSGSFTLDLTTATDFTGHGTSLPSASATSSNPKFNYVILGKPKIVMFAQDR